MWELVIVAIVSVYGNDSFRVEQMPTKEICLEAVDHFRFQTNMVSQNATGHLVVYCRPKQEIKK